MIETNSLKKSPSHEIPDDTKEILNPDNTLSDSDNTETPSIPDELLIEDSEKPDTDNDDSSQEKDIPQKNKGENLELWRQVKEMSMGQKIVLAQNGNKEARALLMRESSKVILRGLVNNARITEQEVLSLAKSRSVDEEILRVIASNLEWTKDYKMKVALVKNPKCPFHESRKFLLYLNKRDLQDIAKSKDVPSALSQYAQKLYSRKAH